MQRVFNSGNDTITYMSLIQTLRNYKTYVSGTQVTDSLLHERQKSFGQRDTVLRLTFSGEEREGKR